MRRSPLRDHSPCPTDDEAEPCHALADPIVELVGFDLGSVASKAEIDALEILLGEDLRRLFAS